MSKNKYSYKEPVRYKDKTGYEENEDLATVMSKAVIPKCKNPKCPIRTAITIRGYCLDCYREIEKKNKNKY